MLRVGGQGIGTHSRAWGDVDKLAHQLSFDRQLPVTSEAATHCQQSQRQLVSVMAES